MAIQFPSELEIGDTVLLANESRDGSNISGISAYHVIANIADMRTDSFGASGVLRSVSNLLATELADRVDFRGQLVNTILASFTTKEQYDSLILTVVSILDNGILRYVRAVGPEFSLVTDADVLLFASIAKTQLDSTRLPAPIITLALAYQTCIQLYDMYSSKEGASGAGNIQSEKTGDISRAYYNSKVGGTSSIYEIKLSDLIRPYNLGHSMSGFPRYSAEIEYLYNSNFRF